MRLKIEKMGNGSVRVELTTDQAKKPLTVDLDPGQVDMLAEILKAACRSENFKFEAVL